MLDKSEQDTIGLLVHSYNNFLAGMMGFTELSLMEAEQEDVRERLELVLASGNEAVVFGKQLLSLTSRLQVTLKPIHLLNIIQEVASGNNVEIINEGVEQNTKVNSDTQWLWHCLESLFQFCKQYSEMNLETGVNPELAFRIGVDQETVSISLNGKGLNFSEEQAENIFEPFYSSRHILGSKDVGVAYIRGFIIQMNGDMRLDREKGFVIEVPLTR